MQKAVTIEQIAGDNLPSIITELADLASVTGKVETAQWGEWTVWVTGPVFHPVFTDGSTHG